MAEGPDKETLAQMTGGLLREGGLLTFVFSILDATFGPSRAPGLDLGILISLGSLMMIAGAWVEIRR